MSEVLEGALVFGALAVFAAAALAWAFGTGNRRRWHEQARANFHAGKVRDPDRYPLGPHKSFRQNFRLLLAAALGFVIAWGLLTLLAGAPR